MQKLTPGFKNLMRNLDNFWQAVESPKIGNSMCYFCPKNTFLQLKHYIQGVYLTLLSTTYVKIHQIPYVIFEIISHFSQNDSSVFSQLKHYNFSDFLLLALKFTKFLMSFLQSFDYSSVSCEIILLYFFSWNFICYWQK